MDVLEFKPFKRRMWVGTLALDALMLAGFAIFGPTFLPCLALGMVLGLVYLKSLMYTTEHPLKKLQFVFSLTRMVCFAYLIYSIGGRSVGQFLVVMCGFLSYKVTLTAEYLIQALPLFNPGKQEADRQWNTTSGQ